MTAGALLLMYQVALALFIGLGPIFILCLLFESTKSLFQKWLFYGIGTMFSMAVLSAMVSIALKMVTDVALGLWATDALSTLIPTLGDGTVVSYSSRAMQTGSMGMILTLLLITVPPMAASFFNGTMGSFTWASAWGGGGFNRTGPGGQAPGTPGYVPMGGERPPQADASRPLTTGRLQGGNYAETPTYSTGSGLAPSNAGQQDAISQGSGRRLATGEPQYVSPQASSSSTQRQQTTYAPPPPEKDSYDGGGRRGA